MSYERTVRDASQAGGDIAPEKRDVLYVVLCGARPLSGGLAVDLSGTDVLAIGRGPALELQERRGDGERWLRLPDDRVSERHAVIDRRRSELLFEDLGSTNGSFLDGEAVRTSTLRDGQLLSLGRTVLLVRRGVREPVLGAPFAPPGAPRLATLSPEVARVHRLLAQAAGSDVPVILRGETGTGKEVAARALHALSGRPGRLVAINCGALPDALIESELFGYRRGAFSGAVQDKTGLVVAARGGTLFLDEIGELPPAAQVKLLRVLQDHEVTPLGAAEATRIDFRLVCATHQDISGLVGRGKFRADLYARIRGLELTVPPLRERPMDIGLIVAALLAEHAPVEAARYRFERRCAEELVRAPWPLNVRELERALQVLLALAGPERLLKREGLEQVAEAKAAAEPGLADPESVRAELVDQLARHHGNISAVARAMQRTRMQIHRWLKRWTIDPESYRRGGGSRDAE